ncbi:unnamed protein product [Rangifer tarandus platyrhynchus]|uniref:Uncharacterized protein n=1 Tax=Rangifer tarandus platyrhynchus TaxID=3082113 RepID=A0ACB1KHD9_RANTA
MPVDLAYCTRHISGPHQLPAETSLSPSASKPASRAIFSFPSDPTGKLFTSWALLHPSTADTPSTLGTLRCASETIFGALGFSKRNSFMFFVCVCVCVFVCV